jgi:hypothetical protein
LIEPLCETISNTVWLRMEFWSMLLAYLRAGPKALRLGSPTIFDAETSVPPRT